MKMNNHLFSLALPAFLCLFAAQLHAEDLICDSGSVCELPPLVDGDVIVTNGSLVRVPTGETSLVTGDVIVSDGGRLSLSNIVVEGDITADGYRSVRISNSFVAGDIDLQDQIDVRPSLTISSSTVGGDVLLRGIEANSITVSQCNFDGDLLVEENTLTRRLSISRNEVGGGVLLFDNFVFESDSILVLRNTILGDLICSGNDPDPIVQNNDVSGDVICEDQPGASTQRPPGFPRWPPLSQNSHATPQLGSGRRQCDQRQHPLMEGTFVAIVFVPQN